MFRRQCGQALAQRYTGILLLHRHFRIVGGVLDRICGLVVQFNVLPAPKRRQGLESRNSQEPGRNGGSAFEFASLAPQIEENLADEIFRNLFIPHEPKPETKHPDMVPSVQHLHGEAVALSDPSDQDVVRSRLCRTQWPSRKVGRIGLAGGSTPKARFFKLSQGCSSICDLPHRSRFSAGHRGCGRPRYAKRYHSIEEPSSRPLTRWTIPRLGPQD